MNSKHTPKSCSCSQCKRGKATKGGKMMMKLDERAFRHNQKISLKTKGENVTSAPIGNYFD